MKKWSEVKLVVGSNPAESKEMCVMEAVAFFAGEPHSDSPDCVSPVIAAFCRVCNDRFSQSFRDEAKRLIRWTIGTRDRRDQERAFMLADAAVRIFAAEAMMRAGLEDECEKLKALPEIKCQKTARAARAVARAAARTAARDAVYSAADAAADAAAFASADAVCDAACASADAAADADKEKQCLALIKKLCLLGREDWREDAEPLETAWDRKVEAITQ